MIKVIILKDPQVPWFASQTVPFCGLHLRTEWKEMNSLTGSWVQLRVMTTGTRAHCNWDDADEDEWHEGGPLFGFWPSACWSYHLNKLRSLPEFILSPEKGGHLVLAATDFSYSDVWQMFPVTPTHTVRLASVQKGVLFHFTPGLINYVASCS